MTKKDRREAWHKLTPDQQAKVKAQMNEKGQTMVEAMEKLGFIDASGKGDGKKRAEVREQAEREPKTREDKPREDKEPDSDRGDKSRKKRVDELIDAMDSLSEDDIDRHAERGYKKLLFSLSDKEFEAHYEQHVVLPRARQGIVMLLLEVAVDADKELKLSKEQVSLCADMLKGFKNGELELVEVEEADDGPGEDD